MPVNYKQYPINWKDEIRPDILKRAGFCCEICLVPQYTKYVVMGKSMHQLLINSNTLLSSYSENDIKTVYLSIAHLDHDIQNNEYSNLKAMCQRCHNRHDAKDRAMNRRIAKANKRNR